MTAGMTMAHHTPSHLFYQIVSAFKSLLPQRIWDTIVRLTNLSMTAPSGLVPWKSEDINRSLLDMVMLFRLVVQRPQEVDLRSMLSLGDGELREALSQILADAAASSSRALAALADDLPTETLAPIDDAQSPAWHRALDDHFNLHRILDETTGHHYGPVDTWFLNGQFAPQCSLPRQVTLTADRNSWEATIVSNWRDHADLQFPFFLHYVNPMPPGGRSPGHIGSVLIVQMPVVHHAAVLLTRSIHIDHTIDHQHLAVYTLNRLSAASVRNLAVPPSLAVSRTFAVRRNGLLLSEEAPQQIADGENIVIESTSSSSSFDEASYMQVFPLQPSRTTKAVANQPLRHFLLKSRCQKWPC